MTEYVTVPSDLSAAEPYDRVLEIDDGQGQTQHVPLTGQTLSIGRAQDVDLHLPRVGISRHHAELSCDRWGRWWIKDLGSRNGTRVNGFGTTERMLELGDCIELGECLLTLTMPSPMLDAGHSSAAGASLGGQDVLVTDDQAKATSISMLRQSQTGTSRISSLHLTQLMELSHQLQRTERQSERLRMLCALLVSEHFTAEAAVVVMVPKGDSPAPPHTLCQPQLRAGHSVSSLYIADALIEAMDQHAEPTLATRAAEVVSGGTGEVSGGVSGGASGGGGAMACPIRHDEEALVLLYMMVPQKYANEEWLTLASLAAEHFKQAEAAWTNRKLAKVNALVEIDLERAQDIQMRLIPQEIDIRGMEIALGFKPCRWVGGDYVDVFELANGNTLLVVADVCGKGLPAALISSSLHTMAHTSCESGIAMLQLVQMLNKHLVTYLPPSRFVTGIFIELNSQTGQMQFINAGHPAPIIINPDGQRRAMDLGDYEPLGLKHITYEPSVDQLEPGQTLCLFTDGLTELKDHAGKMLTSVRLGDHFSQLIQNGANSPLPLVGDQLNELLDAYTGNRLQSDDRTFLLARRAGG